MVLMLTGLTVPDLRNLKRLWPALLEWYQDRRKIKLVVNRFDRGNGLQLKDVEQMVQQPVFATLASDYSCNDGSLEPGNAFRGRRGALQAVAGHEGSGPTGGAGSAERVGTGRRGRGSKKEILVVLNGA